MDFVNNVSLSPNPATTRVSITAPERIQVIKIFTISGEEVMSKAGGNNLSATIIIGLLPKGLYNVRVITDNAVCNTLLYKAS
jgi:hypothetical protein